MKVKSINTACWFMIRKREINILSRLKEKPYQVFYKPPLITVIHKEVDKRKGVLHICKALAFPLTKYWLSEIH